MMLLPHSVPAEQGLLGLIMQNNDVFDWVDGRLPPDDFYVPLYKRMYEVIGQLIRSNLNANPITVNEALKAEGFETVDGALLPHIGNIMENAGLSGGRDSINSLAHVISQRALERKIIILSQALHEAVQANKPDDYRKLQEELAQTHQAFGAVQPVEAIDQLRAAFKAACQGNTMMPTHYPAWDDAFGGIFPTSRYIIAGHGGAGKSALAVNIAWNMARDGKKVRWLSYEEKPEALWWRIIAREADIPITSLRKGLTERQKVQVSDASDKMAGVDFKSFYMVPDVGQMIEACGPCDLIVLDGITSAPAPKAESKVDKAGIVTEYCANLAAKTGAAVIMLAHVNSDSLKNGASMSGIYGGQAATFDPEGIVDLRREQVGDAIGQERAKIITMTVLKNRYGEEGKKYRLIFNGERMVFSDQYQ